MLLSSQDRVIGFGDTYFYPQSNPENYCTCGERYIDCPVRKTVTSYVRANGIPDFSFSTMVPVPTPRRLSTKARYGWPMRRAALLPLIRRMPRSMRRSAFRKFYLETDLMLAALDTLGRYDVYFDGSKTLTRLELIRSRDRPVSSLHLVRHPGAYLYHFQRKGESDLARRLEGWRRYHERARKFKWILGPSLYRLVTYESIVTNPAEFLRMNAKFLGISAKHVREPVRLRPERIHVTGNSMRLRSTEIINMGDRWRGKLSAHWVRAADSLVMDIDWLDELYGANR